MVSMPIVVFVFLVHLVFGDKRCGTDSLVPFTGFKIHRQYKISGLKMPATQQFITLYHCNRGEVDYEKPVKQKSINEVQWDQPFCLLKPRLGSYLPDLPEDTVQSLVPSNKTSNKSPTDVGNSSTLNSNSQMRTTWLLKFSTSLKNFLRYKYDKILEKLTSQKGPLVYTGKLRDEHIKDIENSTLQASLEWESRNLVCYKLARRRKYCKRDISFYIPQTFVGALFECPLSPKQKQRFFQEFSASDTINTFKFSCDPQLAKPIAPLIADYAINQWWDTKLNIFSPKVVHNIPYLSTANPLNMRFSLTETPDMHQDTWATRIRVNEDYDFSELDLHLVSQAMAKSADYIYKLFKPIDFSKLFKQNELENYKVQGKPIADTDLIINTVKRFSTDEKMALLVNLDSKYQKSINYIQTLWDKMLEGFD